MKLTWFATAGFKIKLDDTTILIDPYINRPPTAEPQLGFKADDIDKADYIFLTHGHFDHAIDVGTIAKKTGAKIFCSQKASEIFIKEQVPNEQIRVIKAGETLDFVSFKVTIIKSKHIKFGLRTLLWKFFSWKVIKSIGTLLGVLTKYPKGDVFGYFFELKNESLSFCHFGSGGYYPEELEKFHPDLFLAPVAGRRNAPVVLAKMTSYLKPKMVIGHHWDDFFPPISWRVPIEQFEVEVKKLLPNIIVKIPVPLEEMDIHPMP